MTLEQRNLLLNFLSLSGLDRENKKAQENIFKLISEIIDLLPKEHRKKGIILQSDLVEFIASTKWSYIGYGANLYEAIEEYNLDWTPSVAREITEKARETEKKSA